MSTNKCIIMPGYIHAGQQLRFAHSTLHGHALAGEERFTVEWHQEDDSVWSVGLLHMP